MREHPAAASLKDPSPHAKCIRCHMRFLQAHNSAAGFPLRWFGLFNLPAIAAKSESLHELAEDVHEWLFWTLIALALVHAAAAIFHHVFQHDATLARMLPRGWLRVPAAPTFSPSPEEPRDAV